MCGIVGYASTNKEISSNWLHRAIKSLNHRGPDDNDKWISSNQLIGLGHTRLSIQDLSLSARQPMTYENLGVKIIFNGEIYNHLSLRERIERDIGFKNWKSSSDTESLLMHISFFGINQTLEKINGMYSFAFLDEKNGDLFLARDRVGEKPLFYTYNDGTLRFASELKALLEDKSLNREIDLNALDSYLGFGYIPSENCILKNFNKLAPGTLLHYKICSGDIKIRKYWDIKNHAFNYKNFTNNKKQVIQKLEFLLENAVNRQLIADVPVGILLSGGLDSSLITAFASKKIKNVRTFNISFPGYKKENESSHAQLVSNFFNTNHTELEANPEKIFHLEKLINYFDEPMVDSSMIPTSLVSSEISNYCKVALGGDGSDELFGGYPSHSRHYFLNKYLKFIPNQMRDLISNYATTKMPIGSKGRNWLMEFKTDIEQSLPMNSFIFDKTTRTKLLEGEIRNKNFAENLFLKRVPNFTNVIQRSTIMDFQNYLPEDILVKVDRSSMANSLELRSPFLDKEIIEFAFKIPPHLKVNTRDKKMILKKIGKNILPPEFDFKRKQGFSIPLNQWLRNGPFRDYFWDILNSNNIFFNRKMVNKIMSLQDKGFNNGEKLFALVQFELWKKRFL